MLLSHYLFSPRILLFRCQVSRLLLNGANVWMNTHWMMTHLLAKQWKKNILTFHRAFHATINIQKISFFTNPFAGEHWSNENADCIFGGSYSTRYCLWRNLRRYDGAGGQFSQIGVQSTRISKTQNNVAPRGWSRNHCPKWTTWQNKRYFIQQNQKHLSRRNSCSVRFTALAVEGEMLFLTKITRSEMGIYLCIGMYEILSPNHLKTISKCSNTFELVWKWISLFFWCSF